MKVKVIVIVVLLLALLGGGYFMMKGKSVDSSPKSFKDLLALGLSQKCSFDGGTVYVANGKSRGDFSPNSHMIVDGTTSYIWTDGEKTGFKTTFDLNAQTSANMPTPAGTSISRSFDYDKEANYNCETWISDNSVFELPKEVTFQDFSALIPTPNSGSGSSSQCSYCDSLTGDNKTQCLAALNCN